MTGTEAIIFAGEAHKKFYEEQLQKCRYRDGYHRALIYALGITEDIRNHFKEVYDVENDSIKRGSLHAPWVTGTDARVMRLAFTLYTDYVPDDDDTYNIPAIFSYGTCRLLCQAIQLRYGD